MSASQQQPQPTAEITEPPHPSWTPGEKQAAPFDVSKKVAIDPATEPSCYPLVISSVVPRPIGFLSTLSSDGRRPNLAPFSYFNAVAHDPPMVCVGICRHSARGPGAKKDSLVNIEETGEFVANIMSEWFIEAANFTCGNFDPDVDEMKLAGLTPEPSDVVKPSRVQESAVQMECKLRHSYEVQNSKGMDTTTIILGEVVRYHISEALLRRTPNSNLAYVDINGYQPMARLGGNTYARVTSIFDLPRPDRSWQDKAKTGDPTS